MEDEPLCFYPSPNDLSSELRAVGRGRSTDSWDGSFILKYRLVVCNQVALDKLFNFLRLCRFICEIGKDNHNHLYGLKENQSEYTKLLGLRRQSANDSSFSSSKCFETYSWEISAYGVIFLAPAEGNKWVDKWSLYRGFLQTIKSYRKPTNSFSKDSWKAAVMALVCYSLRHIQADDHRVNTPLSITSPSETFWPASAQKLSLWPAKEPESTFHTGECAQ